MGIFYRNQTTKRLVTLVRVTPRHFTGGYFVEIDAITKKEKIVKKGVSGILGTIKIDPAFYKPVSSF